MKLLTNLVHIMGKISGAKILVHYDGIIIYNKTCQKKLDFFNKIMRFLVIFYTGLCLSNSRLSYNKI